MKVTWLLMTQASGAMGGVVAANNRGGDFLRARVTPSNPRTTQQSRIRAIISSLTSAWTSTLTDGLRAAWLAIASGNDTGQNAYIAANSILLQGLGTRQDTAPATRTGVLTPFVESADLTPAVGELCVTDTGNILWNPANATDSYNAATGGVLNFYLTDQQNTSRLARQFGFTWVSSKVRGGSATSGIQTISTGRTYTTGKIVYLRVTSAGVDGKVTTDQLMRLTVIVQP